MLFHPKTSQVDDQKHPLLRDKLFHIAKVCIYLTQLPVCELKHMVLFRNSAWPISVPLSRHDITHSSMSKLWSPVPLSIAPLCHCHLGNNRNAATLLHPSIAPSLPPQSKARTNCWTMNWPEGGRVQRVNDNKRSKESEI